MQVIPALDLLGDDAVRLSQGDYSRVIFRRPVAEVMQRILASSPSMIHVVDLEGAREGSPRWPVLENCLALSASTPVQFSGGLRSVKDAARALEYGAARVIVGTALWDTPGALGEFVDHLGKQLVAALDVRQGRIARHGWQSDSGPLLEDALEHCRAQGVSRLHVTAIDRDGTMTGPDLSLYERVCAFGIPVVAAGGVRHLEDVAALAGVGCEAAIMGVGYLRQLGYQVEETDTSSLND